MLILSRRIDQKIVIDGPCVLTLLKANNGYARIGFEAAENVAIDRLEIRQAKEANKPEAVRTVWGEAQIGGDK